MPPTEPRRLTDPFVRSLARVRLHPKVDLSLPSRSVLPFIDARFQPSNFPLLLLQETIALGHEFDLVSDLADLMVATPAMKDVGVNLRLYLYLAEADRYLLEGDCTKADAALDAANRHFTSGCQPATAVDLALADFKVTCSLLGSEAALGKIETIHEKFPLILNDPVRRFEVQSELTLGIYGNVNENRTVADWVVSELDRGPYRHEIQWLSCALHKARFAKLTATALPDLAAASHLEKFLSEIRIYADPYSLALAHQLLGELGCDQRFLNDALRVYANLELELPFQETWESYERALCGDPEKRHQIRCEISNQAYNAFGMDSAQRMAREISASLRGRGNRGDGSDPCPSEIDRTIGVEVG